MKIHWGLNWMIFPPERVVQHSDNLMHSIVLYPHNNRLTIQYNWERRNTIEYNTMLCINLSEYSRDQGIDRFFWLCLPCCRFIKHARHIMISFVDHLRYHVTFLVLPLHILPPNLRSKRFFVFFWVNFCGFFVLVNNLISKPNYLPTDAALQFL